MPYAIGHSYRLYTKTSVGHNMTTSAFNPTRNPPGQTESLDVSHTLKQASIIMNSESSNNDAMESETEDEEVKTNCVGGFRGIADSDMNSTDDDESTGGEDKDSPER
jgi:hypothetical protein